MARLTVLRLWFFLLPSFHLHHQEEDSAFVLISIRSRNGECCTKRRNRALSLTIVTIKLRAVTIMLMWFVVVNFKC